MLTRHNLHMKRTDRRRQQHENCFSCDYITAGGILCFTFLPPPAVSVALALFCGCCFDAVAAHRMRVIRKRAHVRPTLTHSKLFSTHQFNGNMNMAGAGLMAKRITNQSHSSQSVETARQTVNSDRRQRRCSHT